LITEAAATWRELYGIAVGTLGEHRGHEARWLVEEVSGGSWPGMADSSATARAARRLTEMLERRAAGEPLQYVLGHWSFRSLDLMVDRRVLIPRPETEQVVEAALAELERTAAAAFDQRGPVVVDLGTGSGAIALSIAAESRRARIWATDSSPGALEVAGANLCGLGGAAATRVRIVAGSWWDALSADLEGKVQLVVSNPPYISTEEMHRLDREVTEWEPREALEAGASGLEAIEEILRTAPRWLCAEGAAVIEVAPHQAAAATAAATDAGFAGAEIRPDLSGRDRVLVARMPP
jgi:release factor glutamine methyltransferase